MNVPFKRPTRRRDTVRPTVTIMRGLVVIAVIGAVGLVLLRAGRSGLPFAPSYSLNVKVSDATGLRPNTGVNVAGVRIGRILDTKPIQTGGALVKIQLSKSQEPLPADTTAVVRAQGLLGARFLELRPGHSSRRLGQDATISETAVAKSVPDALLTFDRETRQAFGDTINALGQGVIGRGEQLNGTIHLAAPVLGELTQLSQAVLARRDAARRLLPSTRRGTTVLDSAREDIARGFRPGGQALEPFVTRRPEVHATLEVAPPTLAAARPGLDEGRRLLVAARDLANAANYTLPPAPTGLRAATLLLRGSTASLGRTASLLAEGRRTIPPLLRVTSDLNPVLAPLDEGLTGLRPIVVEVGARRCDLDNFAENWRSMLGYGVPGGGAIGPMNSIRTEEIASNESIAGAGPTAVNTLQPGQLVNRDPYPRPCKYSPGRPYGTDRVTNSKRAAP